MTEELPAQRVEVSFVGIPPTQQVMRASGVRDVQVEGAVLRCMVCGSFQPFLEALRGFEVISLRSTSSSVEQQHAGGVSSDGSQQMGQSRNPIT